jgi:hypothetical protein
MGSDLPRCLPFLRLSAISLEGTRTAASPATSRSCSKRRTRCRLFSNAQTRSGHWLAQRSASRWPSGTALTVFSASWRPLLSTATKVWLDLCGSEPIVTTMDLVSLRG